MKRELPQTRRERRKMQLKKKGVSIFPEKKDVRFRGGGGIKIREEGAFLNWRLF